MQNTNRLFYLDNLRIAVIILVIAHHVGQAYGPTGGWWPIQEATRAPVLGPFFTVNRSFFMSLFFMISGYFTVMSFRSKGARAFLKDRALRLGIPALVFGLIMIPMQLFVFAPADGPRPSILPIDVGHLWFLEHLLIFSVGYVLWQTFQGNRAEPKPVHGNPPGYLSILAFALALAIVTGIVRIWFPIDKWVYLLGFIRVAFADVPRDLSFFIIGVLAYEQGWFQKFPTRAGYIWLLIGVALAGFWYAYQLGLQDLMPINGIAMDIVRLFWEMLLCFGFCIGLTVLFREKFNMQGRLGKIMAQSQYAAYIFHVLFVLAVQFLVINMALSPFAKFTLVTLAAVPITFLFSNWVRKPLHL
jgi:surface polysaccharide O-acyltransferase-like enzyme